MGQSDSDEDDEKMAAHRYGLLSRAEGKRSWMISTEQPPRQRSQVHGTRVVTV